MPVEERGSHVVTVPAPDTFRGEYRGPDAAEAYAACLDDAIATLHERGHRPAAFIVCTVFSSEGIPDIPDGYLPAAAQRIRAAGGLFIADEVQAGFGRSGEAFWQFARQDVVPDVITMGKPMGNGHPISGVVTRHDLLAEYARKFHYFNTFGGNPVSCAAANAVLDVLESENLQQRALETGQYVKEGLKQLAERFEIMGDVRGAGLFIGVDLVSDRASRAPAADAAHTIKNAMRQRGVLMGTTGPHDNVLKIRPPMAFGREHADVLLEQLGETLTEQT
jgi:4-aminobutyrate aminotransferase-like enzyme